MFQVPECRVTAVSGQNPAGIGVPLLRMDVYAGVDAPYGLMAVPVIKMATRTELANRWFDLMDINAGTIATGEETIEEVGWKLFHFILDVASGKKKTFSDQWGLHNQLAVFNPAPVT